MVFATVGHLSNSEFCLRLAVVVLVPVIVSVLFWMAWKDYMSSTTTAKKKDIVGPCDARVRKYTLVPLPVSYLNAEDALLWLELLSRVRIPDEVRLKLATQLMCGVNLRSVGTKHVRSSAPPSTIERI
jgi:hypothetical protein